MKKLCNHPGCRAVFSGTGFLCSEHRNRNRKFESDKPRNNMAFYKSKSWTTLSRIHRQEFPICEHCNRSVSVEVDHHLEITLDPNKEFVRDDDNLVSVCKSCHITKGNHIRKLIKKGSINEIRDWLIQNHPRPDCVDYLKTASISLESSGEAL